jgi:hypothetical protein
MTGNVPQYGDLDDHHIVPKDWGKAHKGLGGLIDTILNRTPLSADTNRKVIRNRLPNAYIPEIVAANGEATVRAILESHFISPMAFDILLRDPFTPDDFEALLRERQRTIEDAIQDLLIKERLDLAPRLRELDERIEQIELSLRQVVLEALQGDASKLPPLTLQRIKERLEKSAKRDPGLDLDRRESLARMLEYSDLREIESAIMTRPLWARFEPRFGNKETVAAKFGQLAELRNSLRHSRAVGEITHKEGEAAILWFERILRR